MIILGLFKFLLGLSDDDLKYYIDLYNKKMLSEEANFALEAIEAMHDSDVKKEVS